MPVIVVRGLIKAFEGKPVLHEVSLRVNQGDIYGFPGPNDSGRGTRPV
jgi:ABC-2 type transport system ATP-binding protein